MSTTYFLFNWIIKAVCRIWLVAPKPTTSIHHWNKKIWKKSFEIIVGTIFNMRDIQIAYFSFAKSDEFRKKRFFFQATVASFAFVAWNIHTHTHTSRFRFFCDYVRRTMHEMKTIRNSLSPSLFLILIKSLFL